MSAACPDCRDGKHAACTGAAWDDDTDAPAACECWASGHNGAHDPAHTPASPGPSSAGDAGTTPVAASGRGAAAGHLRDEIATVAAEIIMGQGYFSQRVRGILARQIADAVLPIVEQVRDEAEQRGYQRSSREVTQIVADALKQAQP